MKRPSIVLALLFISVFFGCKKEDLVPSNQTPNTKNFIDSSTEFLKSHLSNSEILRLDLETVNVLRFQGKEIGIQFLQKENPKKFLILNTSENRYSGSWIDMTGLNSSNIKDQNGEILIQDISKPDLMKVIIKSNKTDQILIAPNKQSQFVQLMVQHNTISNGSIQKVQYDPVMLPEVIVYDESSKLSFTSLYWLYNRSSSYTNYYFQSSSISQGGGGGASSSSTSNNVVLATTFISPKTPIADIVNELKCFTNRSSSVYYISINVNQPEPKSRTVYNTFSDFSAGHVYFTFSQINADGTSIIRNVGFYPRDFVKPGSWTAQSVFGEDSKTPFDVSLKLQVTAAEMASVLTSLIKQQNATYDINQFNCTNSVFDALGSIDIELPKTKSNSLLFEGYNPADLGEDLRTLDLNEFGRNNGGRKVIRTVSDYNNQKPPSKTGTC